MGEPGLINITQVSLKHMLRSDRRCLLRKRAKLNFANINRALPSYTQGKSQRVRVVKNNKQGITIALLFTVVDMKKQKVIIIPGPKPVITTICYADLTRLQNTVPSIYRPWLVNGEVVYLSIVAIII